MARLSPDAIRKLGALGLTVETIASIAEIIDGDTSAHREKERTRKARNRAAARAPDGPGTPPPSSRQAQAPRTTPSREDGTVIAWPARPAVSAGHGGTNADNQESAGQAGTAPPDGPPPPQTPPPPLNPPASLRSASVGKAAAKAKAKAKTAEMEADWTQEFHEIFWPKYPHKVGRKPALEAFFKVRQNGIELQRVIDGLAAYIRAKPVDHRYLNPTTFLNQERFNDEPAIDNAVAGQGRPTAHEAFRRGLAQSVAEGGRIDSFGQHPQADPAGGPERQRIAGDADHGLDE